MLTKLDGKGWCDPLEPMAIEVILNGIDSGLASIQGFRRPKPKPTAYRPIAKAKDNSRQYPLLPLSNIMITRQYVPKVLASPVTKG